MILAGLEILALPLSGVLIKGAIKFVIYIGIGGVFGVLIGALLITAGLVVWFNPTHRVFYGVAGIVLGLLSFPASNLGGFLLGMLLAIFGGAAAIAWTPLDAVASPPAGPLPASSAEPLAAPSAGSTPAVVEGLGELGFAGEREPGSMPQPGSIPAPRREGNGHNGTSGQRFLALTAMPALIVAGVLTSGTARTAPASTYCILGLICVPVPGSGSGASGGSNSPSPTATPSPSARPSPSASATPDPPGEQPAGDSASAPASASPGSPSASPSATPSGSPSDSATGNPKTDPSTAPDGSKTGDKAKNSTKTGSKKVVVKKVAAPSGLEAASATSVLTAGAATLDHFQFVGIVNLPVAGGGTEQTLEFTASSASLSGDVNVAVTQNGFTTNTSSPELDFSDDMTLYSTRLCGDIYGITGQVCFTPSTIDEVLLKVTNVLTGVVPISMTDVTTDQPVTTAGGLRTGSLTLG